MSKRKHDNEHKDEQSQEQSKKEEDLSETSKCDISEQSAFDERTELDLDRDPDYEGYEQPTPAKKLKLDTDAAKEATIRKITQIIKEKFDEEIRSKENEVFQIDNRLQDARSEMDRLRACVVTCFYRHGLVHTPAQPTIHPTVKKLINQRVQATDCSKKDDISEDGKDRTMNSQFKTDQQKTAKHGNSHNETSETFSSVEMSKDKIKQVKRVKEKRTVIVGNVSRFLPPETRAENEQATHKWMTYVRGPRDNPNISDVIDEIVFLLHPSYRPHDVVTVSESPFHLTRRGWGEFPLRVQLHFRDSRNKKVDIIHNIKLDKTYTGLQTLGAETVVEIELEKEVETTLKKKPIDKCQKDITKNQLPDLDLSDSTQIETNSVTASSESAADTKEIFTNEIESESSKPAEWKQNERSNGRGSKAEIDDNSNMNKVITSSAVSVVDNLKNTNTIIDSNKILSKPVTLKENPANVEESNSLKTASKFESEISNLTPHIPIIEPSKVSHSKDEANVVIPADTMPSEILNSKCVNQPTSESINKLHSQRSDHENDRTSASCSSNISASSPYVFAKAVNVNQQPLSIADSLKSVEKPKQRMVKCVDKNGRVFLINQNVVLQSLKNSKSVVSSKPSASQQGQKEKIVTLQSQVTVSQMAMKAVTSQAGIVASSSAFPSAVLTNLAQQKQQKSIVNELSKHHSGPPATSSITGLGSQSTSSVMKYKPPISSVTTQSPSVAMKSQTALPLMTPQCTSSSFVNIRPAITKVVTSQYSSSSYTSIPPATTKIVSSQCSINSYASIRPNIKKVVNVGNSPLGIISNRQINQTDENKHETNIIDGKNVMNNTLFASAKSTVSNPGTPKGSVIRLVSPNQLYNKPNPNSLLKKTHASSLLKTMPQKSLLRPPSNVVLKQVETNRSPVHVSNKEAYGVSNIMPPLSAKSSISLSSPMSFNLQTEDRTTNDSMKQISPLDIGSVAKKHGAVQIRLTNQQISTLRQKGKTVHSLSGSNIMDSPTTLQNVAYQNPTKLEPGNYSKTQIINGNNALLCDYAKGVSNIRINEQVSVENKSKLQGQNAGTFTIVQQSQNIKCTENSIFNPGQPELINGTTIIGGSAIVKPVVIAPCTVNSAMPLKQYTQTGIINLKSGETLTGNQVIIDRSQGIVGAMNPNSQIVLNQALPVSNLPVETNRTIAHSPPPQIKQEQNYDVTKEPMIMRVGKKRSESHVQQRVVQYTSVYPNHIAGDEKVLLHQLLHKHRQENGPQQVVLPDYELRSFNHMEEVMCTLVRHFPIVQEDPDRAVHPYCAPSVETWYNWPLPKRRAHELCRAVFMRRALIRLLEAEHRLQLANENHVGPILNQSVPSNLDIVRWCRRHLYTPIDRTTVPQGAETSTPLLPEQSLTSLTLSDELMEFCKVNARGENGAAKMEDQDDDCMIIDIVHSDNEGDEAGAKVQHAEISPMKHTRRHYLPPTPQQVFVQNICSKIGVRMRAIQVEGSHGDDVTRDAVYDSVCEQMLWQCAETFMESLLRRTLATVYDQNRVFEDISVQDIFNAITNTSYCDFLSNSYLATTETDLSNS